MLTSSITFMRELTNASSSSNSRCAQFSHFSAALKKNHRQDERWFLWKFRRKFEVDTGNRQREHCHGDALRSARRAPER